LLLNVSRLFIPRALSLSLSLQTFTRWANTYLKERMMKVNDLQSDFSDGVLLINLLEVISSKEIRGYNKKPKLRPQKMENNDFALQFLKREGIKLVNIGASGECAVSFDFFSLIVCISLCSLFSLFSPFVDITDCKLKLILGLIWTIILRYQIQIEEGKSARSDLLKWVRQQIPEYNINNFGKDWNDGKAIVALSNSLEPGIYPNHMQLDANDSLENAKLGTDLAEKHFEIPKVLAPEDMVNSEVDELSVMTYISYFRDYLNHSAKRKEAEILERTPVASKVCLGEMGCCCALFLSLSRSFTPMLTATSLSAVQSVWPWC
jgi:filamin